MSISPLFMQFNQIFRQLYNASMWPVRNRLKAMVPHPAECLGC